MNRFSKLTLAVASACMLVAAGVAQAQTGTTNRPTTTESDSTRSMQGSGSMDRPAGSTNGSDQQPSQSGTTGSGSRGNSQTQPQDGTRADGTRAPADSQYRDQGRSGSGGSSGNGGTWNNGTSRAPRGDRG